MGRKVKLQKICLKKYFRHKDEKKEEVQLDEDREKHTYARR